LAAGARYSSGTLREVLNSKTHQDEKKENLLRERDIRNVLECGTISLLKTAQKKKNDNLDTASAEINKILPS